MWGRSAHPAQKQGKERHVLMAFGGNKRANQCAKKALLMSPLLLDAMRLSSECVPCLLKRVVFETKLVAPEKADEEPPPRRERGHDTKRREDN